MQQADSGKRKSKPRPSARAKGKRPGAGASFQDRLKSAGFDPDADPPADIDEFRNALARRINILIANRARYWRSCKETACRRAHACLAPRIHCSNAPPLPPLSPEQAARRRAEVMRAVREAADRMERKQG